MYFYSLSIIISFLVLSANYFSVTAQSNSGWKYQNFVPDELYSVSFVDSLTGWAVGSSELIHTSDGGKNWVYQDLKLEFRKYMRDVFFLNSDEGWVVGNEIWHTKNGGKSWNIQSNGITKSNFIEFSSVFFIDEENGWAAGDSNLILRTTDAGNNWEAQTVGSDGRAINSLSFVDSQNGWALNSGNILNTTNSGKDWDTAYVSDDIYFGSVLFLDSLRGWACANSGLVLNTTDGGNSWDTTNVDFNWSYSAYFHNIYFTDENNGVLIGTEYDSVFNPYPLIFITSDGGKTWTFADYVNTLLGLNSLSYAGNKTYFSVGGNSILKSTDAGKSWNNQISKINSIISDIYFADENYGWAFDNSQIYRSTNGGENWNIIPTGYTGLNVVTFKEQNNCWIGLYDKIIHTSNGGLNWKEFSFPDEFNNPQSIEFVNSSLGFAAGWNEPIIQTTDGGNHWEVGTTEEYYIRDLFFLNENFGWAAGIAHEQSSSRGQIVLTTNGGTDWQDVKTFEGHHYYVIYFINEEIGWAVGSGQSGGIVVKSTDGGKTWPQSIEIIGRPTDVHFVDENNGWLTTGSGDIHSTTNGGIDWEKQLSIYKYSALNSIHFIDKNTGWAAGWDGIILKTTNGGITSVDYSNEEAKPTNFDLTQNYPNPFNPTTTINFTIPIVETQHAVSLRVYDILGRHVATLVNVPLSTGTYQVEFDGSKYSSGVYFYELIVAKFRDVKKLVLIK